jgi:hypothetical protein
VGYYDAPPASLSLSLSLSPLSPHGWRTVAATAGAPLEKQPEFDESLEGVLTPDTAATSTSGGR